LILILLAIASSLYGGDTILKIGVSHSVVSGQSMENTLSDGTKLLFINDDFKGIKRGDIVSVLAYEYEKKIHIIKRVIAMPNETIHIKGNKVYINGDLLEEPYAYYSGPSEDVLTITLLEGEYFVMGDNRLHSGDSRVFGPVPKENILEVLLNYSLPKR
jgi:signal peptidase I